MCHARLWGAAVRLASWLSCPFLRPQNVAMNTTSKAAEKPLHFFIQPPFRPEADYSV
jgi:hypothetical protein